VSTNRLQKKVRSCEPAWSLLANDRPPVRADNGPTAQLWDQEDIDLVAPGFIEFGDATWIGGRAGWLCDRLAAAAPERAARAQRRAL
jgi:hypothetical protein